MSDLEENPYIKLNNDIEQLKKENKHIQDMLIDIDLVQMKNNYLFALDNLISELSKKSKYALNTLSIKELQ